jgi:hypothetical protein
MKIIIADFLLILLLVFAGCARDPQKRLHGVWSSETNGISYLMVLEESGSGSMNIGGISFICTYQADSESITIEVDTDVATHSYTLSPGGKTLEIRNFLTSGINVTFNRQ